MITRKRRSWSLLIINVTPTWLWYVHPKGHQKHIRLFTGSKVAILGYGITIITGPDA